MRFFNFFLLPVLFLFVSCNKQNSLQMFSVGKQFLFLKTKSTPPETRSTFYTISPEQEDNGEKPSLPSKDGSESGANVKSTTTKVNNSVSFAVRSGSGTNSNAQQRSSMAERVVNLFRFSITNKNTTKQSKKVVGIGTTSEMTLEEELGVVELRKKPVQYSSKSLNFATQSIDIAELNYIVEYL